MSGAEPEKSPFAEQELSSLSILLRVKDLESKQNTHEAVCAQRYENLQRTLNGVWSRITVIEKTLTWAMRGVITSSAASVAMAISGIATLAFFILTKH
jgi:hypothetical protein